MADRHMRAVGQHEIAFRDRLDEVEVHQIARMAAVEPRRQTFGDVGQLHVCAHGAVVLAVEDGHAQLALTYMTCAGLTM